MTRSKLINQDKAANKESKFTENTDDILNKPRKKADTSKDKYRTFKMQNEVYREFEAIAEEKEIRYAGELIHTVLRKWIEEYKKSV